MNTLMDNLYVAWVIGTKDILDALKSKNPRSNIILMVGMVVFFYWLNNLRPFDKNVTVIVYDESHTTLALEKVTLEDGAVYTFRPAVSLQEMETRMANQNLGLVLPKDFDQALAAGRTPILSGYIFWVDRGKVAELETRYSRDFTKIIGQPVKVTIGENIIIRRFVRFEVGGN